MAPHFHRWLLIVALACALLFAAQPAHAARVPQAADTPTPTDTATFTPTPTATPAPTGTPGYDVTVTLDSGNQLLIERRWTFGELGIFLAVLADIAFNGLRLIYELARREVR